MRLEIRRLRSSAVKSAVVGVAALAVLLPAGLAAAATTQRATTAQLPATTFTWHKLTLLNGWKAYGNGDATPGYAISGGVVYLRGSLIQPVAGSTEFAVLPKAARPSHTLYRTVYTTGITTGTLQILPDGIMQASGTNASAYTSLAAVSYPVAGVTWHKLTLIHGWTSGQHPYSTGDPAYAVKGGVVYLSGSLQQASGSNNLFAVLPKAARPAHKMYLAVYTYGYSVGDLIVTSNGDMYAGSSPQSNAQGFTSLAAISYPAPGTTWHKLSLIHGWKPVGTAFGSPAYAVIGGVVYLSGSLRQPAGWNNNMMNLPAAARPAHYLEIATLTAGGTTGTVQFAANGIGEDNSNPYANAQGYTSLSAISYPRTS
jgi:hypothetical protein